MSDLWGSIPVIQDTESGIAAIEREQMTKPRPLDVEGPLLYQPSTTTYKPCDDLNLLTKGVQVDELTRHTIQLLQYNRKLQAKLQHMKLRLESNRLTDRDLSDIPPTPPVPAGKGFTLSHKSDQALRFIPRDEMSLFFRGFGKAPPRIDKTTCQKLLRQSVSAMCAHAGYETCSELTLGTLTSVCGEFLRQMTTLLRTAVDGEAQHGDAGFPDAISRVLCEIGVGDFSKIHEFYQTRIIGYHSSTHQMAKNLYTDCERYRNADSASGLMSASQLPRSSADSQHFSLPSAGYGEDEADAGDNSYSGLETARDGSVSQGDVWRSEYNVPSEERMLDGDTYYDSYNRQSADSFLSPSLSSPHSNRAAGQSASKRMKRS